MNKYFNLGTLVGALSVGCAANSAVVEPAKPVEAVAEAEPQQPEEFKWPYFCDKIDLKDGYYRAGTPVMPATYMVWRDATICRLSLEKAGVCYIDLYCDNTLDSIDDENSFTSREQVAKEGGDISIFDTALRLGQSYACEENRIDKYIAFKQ